MPSDALVWSAAAGDPVAVSQVFQELERVLRSSRDQFCFESVRATHSPEDAIQQALIAGWRVLGKISGWAALVAYARIAAIRSCGRAYQRSRRLPMQSANFGYLSEVDPKQADPSDIVASREVIEAIFTRAANDAVFSAAVMAAAGERSRDIGEVQGVRERTARLRVMRGQKAASKLAS